ncbi:hypothetical protein QOZ95_005301 [Paenibacillus brasilensis]|uniref:Uncharacterized protein n=1 Tax=Paenibacillus brasilensis TaxID=128574 RepID=A0ABU0L753_9BACL|nr:hypothetical protein [Paenibacillus brasilensis]
MVNRWRVTLTINKGYIVRDGSLSDRISERAKLCILPADFIGDDLAVRFIGDELSELVRVFCANG